LAYYSTELHIAAIGLVSTVGEIVSLTDACSLIRAEIRDSIPQILTLTLTHTKLD